MTYVVKDACIKCKYTDCVSVCPVDCFYEGENFLAINPDECIDCGVCEPECPAGAIVPDTELDPNDPIDWVEVNRKYSQDFNWPVITDQIDPMPDADKLNPKEGYDGPSKFSELSEKPGVGDE
jgi:ferredoxin